jgi:hypothetical protein
LLANFPHAEPYRPKEHPADIGNEQHVLLPDLRHFTVVVFLRLGHGAVEIGNHPIMLFQPLLVTH